MSPSEIYRRQMAGLLPGRAPPEQGPLLQSRPGGPGLRQQSGQRQRQRGPGLAEPRVRRCLSVSALVVRRLDRGARRRQAAGSARPARVRSEPAQRPLLAGAPREGLRQVSNF